MATCVGPAVTHSRFQFAKPSPFRETVFRRPLHALRSHSSAIKIRASSQRLDGPAHGGYGKGKLKLFEDFDGIKRGIPMFTEWGNFFDHVTPLKVTKWSLLLIAAWTLLQIAFSFVQATLLNPALLTRASWLLVVWPWPVVTAIGLWSLFVVTKQRRGKAKEWEQVGLLGSGLLWLILVPLGHFHGYIDGWPVFLFLFYLLFFCVGTIVRLRMHGRLSPKSEDKQWATKTSRLAQVAFVVSVVGGHWMAAKEAVNMAQHIPWSNTLAICVLWAALALHWQATFYLGKYFDRLVVPKQVVIYGPYRFMRHPIYTSYILLFAGYCLALRSYLSLAFLVAASAIYYHYRVTLEEELLLKNFGQEYSYYMEQTSKRFIPFII